MSEDILFGRALANSARTRGQRRSAAHVLLHGVEHKSCAKCASLKPLADFGVKHGTSDELNPCCLDCDRKRKRESYARKRSAA